MLAFMRIKSKGSMAAFLFVMCLEIILAMRVLIWFVRIVLFILLFGFAARNTDKVDLLFFFGKKWSFPLIFIILVAFSIGALMGATARVASSLRQRREISRLSKQLARAELAAEQASDAAARLTEPS